MVTLSTRTTRVAHQASVTRISTKSPACQGRHGMEESGGGNGE